MKRKIALIFLMLLFLGVAVFSGVRLYQIRQEYKVSEAAYDALYQYIKLPASKPVQPEEVPQPEDTPDADQPVEAAPVSDFPVVDFEGLWEICPDVVAWLAIDDTVVSYPVVQADDNAYYLRRLIDGTSNKAGSLFMDYENSYDFTDKNTVIYGHNLKAGTMFHTITKYKKQSFFDEHPTARIMTPYGNYTLEFFAGYVASLDDEAWKLEFDSDEEFEDWLEDAEDNSPFQSDVIPTADDRVVTLSTCSYEFNDARYVLLGVLRPEQEA